MFKKILDLLNFPIPKTLNPNTCSLHYNPTQNERIFKLFQTLSPQSSRYVIADPSSVTRHLTRITEANKTGDDLERVGSVARIDLDRVRSGIGPDSCSSLSLALSPLRCSRSFRGWRGPKPVATARWRVRACTGARTSSTRAPIAMETVKGSWQAPLRACACLLLVYRGHQHNHPRPQGPPAASGGGTRG